MAAGLDSLGAVELRNAITAAYNIQLPATAVLDFPTLASLASHLTALLSSAASTADLHGSVGRSGYGARAQGRRRIHSVPAGPPGAVDLADTTAQLLKVVENVLGVPVTAHQPLMEASSARMRQIL